MLACNRSRIQRICAVVATLWITALALPTSSQAGNLDQTGCRSRTVRAKVQSIQRSARRVLLTSLRPDARPQDWAQDFETIVAESVLMIGLCEEEKLLERACPFCNISEHVMLTPETAPALLLQWLLDRPLFEGRPPQPLPRAPYNATHSSEEV